MPLFEWMICNFYEIDDIQGSRLDFNVRMGYNILKAPFVKIEPIFYKMHPLGFCILFTKNTAEIFRGVFLSKSQTWYIIECITRLWRDIHSYIISPLGCISSRISVYLSATWCKERSDGIASPRASIQHLVLMIYSPESEIYSFSDGWYTKLCFDDMQFLWNWWYTRPKARYTRFRTDDIPQAVCTCDEIPLKQD